MFGRRSPPQGAVPAGLGLSESEPLQGASSLGRDCGKRGVFNSKNVKKWGEKKKIAFFFK